MGIEYGINLGTPVMADLWLGTAGQFWQFFSGPLRPDGYPARVDATTGGALLPVAMGWHLPAGEWTVQVDGKGTVAVAGTNWPGGPWVVLDCPGGGTTTRAYTSPADWQVYQGEIQFAIRSSDESDPIRNVRIWMPGHRGELFYRPYLDMLSHFSTFRFMDWGGVNGCPWVEWADRSAGWANGFSLQGMLRIPYEHWVSLCNETGKGCWVNIPALASDDFVAKMATLFDSGLAPGIPLYVEFSNEVWNYSMPQWGQLWQKLGNISWEGIADLDARATSVFRKNVTSGRPFKVVLARQGGYDATLQVAQERYALAGAKYDAIAPAPYFYSTADLRANSDLYATDPATAITNVLEGMTGPLGSAAQTVAENLAVVARWKGYADKAGVPLLFYECGQSLMIDYDPSAALVAACNRDPRMGAIYREFVAGLPDGIGPLCWYNDLGSWSKWGCWSALEYLAQATESPPPPKWAAILEALAPPATPPPPPPGRRRRVAPSRARRR